MFRMTEGFLQAGHEVTVLSIATDKHPWTPEKIPADVMERTKMDAMYIDTRVRWLPAFLALFKTTSYNIDRFYNFGFEAKLIALLAHQEFDIIQLESLFVCSYIPAIRRLSKAKVILRAHNTESAIWKKNAEEEPDTFKKLWFRDLAGKLERYEREVMHMVDAIVPITHEDRARLIQMGAQVPMHTATFAMNIELAPSPGIVPLPETVFHLGAMDWKPNYDGVKWLCSDVWPLVLAERPDAQLHLAGKGMVTQEFTGLKNITAHGEVPDAGAFISRYSVMTVPLHSGGGVKVKMIEGMFAAKPIVTTTVGIEGIQGKDGEDYYVADDAPGFARRITELLSYNELGVQMGAHARQTAMENHNLSRVTEKLSDFYRSILRG
jgi:polysaccharide biosynthesis protein PslH